MSIALKSQSVGGVTTGATSYCSFSNSGFIGLSGQTGNVLNWLSSTDGGVTWTSIANTAANQSYFNLTQTTCYSAVVQNGAFPPDTSGITCITINQPTVAGTVNGSNTFCGTTASGVLTLSGNIGTVLNWQSSADGGVTWTTISNTSSTLNYSGVTQTTIYEAVVQNTGACAIDTSSQATVTVLAPSIAGTVSYSGGNPLCYLVNSGTLTLIGNSGTIVNWISSTDNGTSWQAISNTSSVQTFSGLIQNTQFAAVVQNGTCPEDTSSIIAISLFPQPAPVFAGIDTIIQAGDSVQLFGSGTGTPFWLPVAGLSDPAVFNPVAAPAVTSTYTLVVTDANGCINADTIAIIVEQLAFDGIISNYFSPDGDGINDAWYIEGIKLFPQSHVAVYNIYGQPVFEKEGYQNDWKGTYKGSELPDGTYFYVLTFSDTAKVYKGTIDILHKK